jgi:hypothetical protein
LTRDLLKAISWHGATAEKPPPINGEDSSWPEHLGNEMSGRPLIWASIERTQSIVIDVNQLARARCIAHHMGIRRGRFVVGDVLDVSFATDQSVLHASTLTLTGVATTHVDGEFPLEQRLRLTRVRAGFGGHRWYFLCPRSGRRVAKLYLPNGARSFASRQAYRLIYATQQEDAQGRAQRAAVRVWRRLGGDPYDWVPDAEPPSKLKWMRWRTYERLIERLEDAEARYEAAWFEGAARLFYRARGLGI